MPVARIDFPTHPRAGAFLEWDLPPAVGDGPPVRILMFGHINKNKCIHRVIQAIGSRPALREGVLYTVLGAVVGPDYHESLLALIQRLGLGHAVRLVGNQPDDVLLERLREADAVVNLRDPHFGESSWSLLEALFAARPSIVWDHGSYAEFPDEAVLKVSTDQGLAAALEELCRLPSGRRLLGEQARRYAVRTYRGLGLRPAPPGLRHVLGGAHAPPWISPTAWPS